MGGSEASLWRNLKRGTKGTGIDWQRHEDKYSVGIPDLSFGLDGIGGWVELKYREAFPQDPDQAVRCRHFTHEQRAWLKRRGRASGHCFLLWQIGKEYFLFDWRSVSLIGKLTRQQLIKESILHCERYLNVGLILHYLINRV